MTLEPVVIRSCIVERAYVEVNVGEYLFIFFFNDAAPLGKGIMIERCLDEPDESEVVWGMDTYLFSIYDSEAQHCYGGLSSCILRGKNLDFEFKPEASEVFGRSGLRLQLEISEDSKKRLEDGLQRMFQDDPRAPNFDISS